MRSLTFVLALCLTATLAAAQKPLLAVMPLETSDVKPGEAQLLGDAVSTRLQETGSFRVMERSQMEKILGEQGFQQTAICSSSTDCAVRMGQILGIDNVVVGSVGRLGTAWVVNLRMVSVASGEVVASTSQNQKGEISDLITEIAPRAVSDLTSKAACASDAKSGAQSTQVEEKSSRAWLWWTLGGVAVIGGGVATAILLMSDDASSTPAPAPSGNSNPNSSGSFEVKWQ